jgi:uncharacterized surface protein with fasciclin (FAS1) repeats
MKIKNQIIKLMFAIVIAFTAFSCSDDDKKEVTKFPTILEIAQSDPASFSVLVKALQATSLTSTASGPGSYTVFAPTNTAFAAYTSTLFPTGVTEALFLPTATPLTTAQIAELRRLLQNHILGVGTKAGDLIASATVTGYVKTFASGAGTGTTLSMFVNQVGSDVLINGGSTNGGAKVTKANIDASNGIVHVVDNVIKLPTILAHAKANPDLATLVAVLSGTAATPGTFGDQSAIVTALSGAGPLTVFAPLNSAFTAATSGSGFLTGAAVTPANVTKVLKYHVSTGNLASSSATSWTSATATTPATITTLVGATSTFAIGLGTVKITELPAITVPASNIKFVNIQATNGIIHTIDRVLQPVLP